MKLLWHKLSQQVSRKVEDNRYPDSVVLLKHGTRYVTDKNVKLNMHQMLADSVIIFES